MDRGWQPHVVSGGSLTLDFLACLRRIAAAVLFASQSAAPLYMEELHSARSFVQGGAPLSTVNCTGRSSTQHGPLYREERHSARSFVQGGAPLSTGLCTGRSATQHGPEQCVYLLVAHHRRVLSAAGGLACELHDLPIVTETASG